MSEYDVTILNLDGGRQMRRSTKRAKLLLQEIQANASVHARVLTPPPGLRGVWGVTREVMKPVGLLHVMAHASPSGQLERRTWQPLPLDIANLAAWVREVGHFPQADGVLLDACSTFTRSWQEGIERTLAPGQAGVLIGTKRKVTFMESAIYTNSFYGALLSKSKTLPSGGAARRARYLDAHRRAVEAYSVLTGKKSVYDAVELFGAE